MQIETPIAPSEIKSMPNKKRTNSDYWNEAKKYLVGGVNSPVRSFRAVGGDPFFVERGDGPYLWDVEGRRYLDYVGSWGALILGHRPAPVIRAAGEALQRGTTFGTPTPRETELARAITQAVPSMQQVRFVSSGTEAVMSALRLARAATGRAKILKFEGAYHGHSDALLSNAGSGLATLGIPSSPGVPRAVTQNTITVPFNDVAAVEQAFHRGEIACVIVEPVVANMGVIPPQPGFLAALRKITRRAKALLIFDEVITGFRVAYGGAQELYDVAPDLTILGKIIGGGFPIGAYGGSRKLMQLVAPAGPVYQAGTLSGHPVAMAAGLATLEMLRRPGTYARLEMQGGRLQEGLSAQVSPSTRNRASAGIPISVQQVGSLLTLFFTDGAVTNAADAKQSDTARYAKYFRGMLKRGIYLPPSNFEAWFISLAHGNKELDMTLKAHQATIKEL